MLLLLLLLLMLEIMAVSLHLSATFDFFFRKSCHSFGDLSFNPSIHRTLLITLWVIVAAS